MKQRSRRVRHGIRILEPSFPPRRVARDLRTCALRSFRFRYHPAVDHRSPFRELGGNRVVVVVIVGGGGSGRECARDNWGGESWLLSWQRFSYTNTGMTSASDYALSLRSRQSTSSNAEPNVSVYKSKYLLYTRLVCLATLRIYFVKSFLIPRRWMDFSLFSFFFVCFPLARKPRV